MRDAYKYIFCRRTLKYILFAIIALVAVRVVYLWVCDYAFSPDKVGIHFKELSADISTVRTTDNLATISITATLQNESDKDRTVVTKVELTDGYYVEKTIEIKSHTERDINLTTDIYEPKFSTSDLENTYEGKFSVLLKKKVLDQVVKSFTIIKQQ